ncbi:MAG: hypothetical protein JNL08_08595 [Planctomycetes bacterium]|nr:hypothetical protein [Planctomycetota bacterium]
MTDTSPRLCPTCAVQVPQRTGRFCPACGNAMDAAPRARNAASTAAPTAAPTATVANASVAAAMAAAPAASLLSSTTPTATTTATATLPGLDQVDVARPVAFAAGGALAGALLWSLVMYGTGMEIGYVAWAVGGLAGGAAVLGGGRGTTTAVLAAAMALLGIVGGKFLGAHFLVEQQIEQLAALMDRPGFERLRAMAADLPAAPGGETDADAGLHEVEDAPDADLADAADEAAGEAEPEADAEGATEEPAAPEDAEAARQLERLRDPSFTYEQWRDEQVAALRAEISLVDLVGDSLGFVDVIFVLLGLSTAFGLVRRATVAAA